MSRAAKIAHALGGATRNGRGWLARCPAHDDSTPSLSIAMGEHGQLLLNCFTGCGFRMVLAALTARGLLDKEFTCHPQTDYSVIDKKPDTNNTEIAMRLWREGQDAFGSPVHDYLYSRGILLPLPPTIRHHPSLKHVNGQFFPAMLGLVEHGSNGRAIGIHRTFLAKGSKEKAPVKNNKMMLGKVAGGAVRLAACTNCLAVTEGIETGLSVQQATGRPTWAALSAIGLEKLELPALPLASDVLIAADNDASGRGMRAATIAGERWLAEGRTVHIKMPPIVGQDFNDVLMEKKS